VLIVDANVIVATMNRRDKNHGSMSILLEGRARGTGRPVHRHTVRRRGGGVPGAEVRRAAAEIQFVEAIRDGVFHQEELDRPDLDRVVEIMRQFQDLPLGLADASIIAVAERLKIREIASIDSHFRAVRPHGIDFFTLLP
jgi:uncharacterized protein